MYFLPLCSYLCMIGVKIFNSSCISFAFFFFFNFVSLAYFRCVSVLFFACFVSLCSVCFDFKLIPEMIFRKIGCLVVTSNLVKLKSISSWPKNIAKTTKNDLCFHFHFKWLPALENRREKERKSKKIADVGARRSHRSKTIAPLRSFKPTLVEPSHRSSRSSRHFRTTREERDRKRKKIDNRTRSTMAPVRRSHQIDDRTSPTIAPDRRSHQSNSNTARSRLRRTISHSPPPIEPSRPLFLLLSIWPDLMNFFAGFCFFCEWVWNWFIFHMFTAEEVYGKLGGLAM